MYWLKQKRGVQKGDDVWLPNMCNLEMLEAGGKKRRKAPMQSMAEQLEGNATHTHPQKEPLHKALIEKAVEEVFEREEEARRQKEREEQ